MSSLKTTNILHPSSASNNIVLDSSGNIAVQAGTAGAPAIQANGDSNTGIYFPAADNIGFTTGGTIRGRWTTDGLCFNADTAAANALDDYEEGTFTPALTYGSPGTLSITFSNQAGVYTKVGNLVYINILIAVSAFTKGTASGGIRITNLPFTPRSTLNSIPFSIGYYSTPLTTTAGQFPAIEAFGNQTWLDLYYASNNSTGVDFTDPDANSQYKISGCYLI